MADVSLNARAVPPRVSGETYFFRDQGQFDLLRFQLVPELIAHRRERQTLRLWSAGCATGEEPYSLAMLIDMLMPERSAWRIEILGSDVNGQALARARQGRYGKWSLRMAPETLLWRYFRHDGEEWTLNDEIRRMVAFRGGNLVEDPLPAGDFRDVDLILCRNVFIYYDPDTVQAVADKLAACLAEGGYLMTGHTELIGRSLPTLRSRLFPEGVVYQRRAGDGDEAPAPPNPPAARPPVQRAPTAPRPPRPPTAAPARGRAMPPPSAGTAAGDPLARAQALADRGDYAAAETACREALAKDALAPAPHFLLAQLAQLGGDADAARTHLERTIYLAPGFVAAYLELAALLERAGQPSRALTRRRAALDILRALPADEPVPPFEAPAGELAGWLMQTKALR